MKNSKIRALKTMIKGKRVTMEELEDALMEFKKIEETTDRKQSARMAIKTITHEINLRKMDV